VSVTESELYRLGQRQRDSWAHTMNGCRAVGAADQIDARAPSI